MLTSASGGATLSYDPMQRLYETVGGGVTTRMAYDGASLIAEYNGSNVLQRRYVHGPGTDEPLVWYEGTGTSDRRWLHADERGSIVAVSNSSGAVTNINAYDEYGIPRPTNVGRFQYTGQQWIAELGLYHYRARIYSPTLGRFLQTDPIGYGDGMNLYAYVGNDPVNFTDPSGLTQVDDIKVVGPWPKPQNPYTANTIMLNMIDLRNIIDRMLNLTNPEEPGTDDAEEKLPDCGTPGVDPENCTPVVNGTRIPRVVLAQLTMPPPGAGFGAPDRNPFPRSPRRRRTPDRCSLSPDSVGGVNLRGACYHHDLCYGSRTPRSVCDSRLFEDIYAECRRAGGDGAACFSLGFTYYVGVRIFGDLPYSPPGD